MFHQLPYLLVQYHQYLIWYNHNQLDIDGVVPINKEIDETTILIGKGIENQSNTIQSNRNEKGRVYNSFVSNCKKDTQLAKVQIIESIIPEIGDTISSRSGMKSTIGIILDEIDMPFTKNGTTIDIIIHPDMIFHQNFIGLFLETNTGKVSSCYGGIGDCTSFNKEEYLHNYGTLLLKEGFHSNDK